MVAPTPATLCGVPGSRPGAPQDLRPRAARKAAGGCKAVGHNTGPAASGSGTGAAAEWRPPVQGTAVTCAHRCTPNAAHSAPGRLSEPWNATLASPTYQTPGWLTSCSGCPPTFCTKRWRCCAGGGGQACRAGVPRRAATTHQHGVGDTLPDLGTRRTSCALLLLLPGHAVAGPCRRPAAAPAGQPCGEETAVLSLAQPAASAWLPGHSLKSDGARRPECPLD